MATEEAHTPGRLAQQMAHRAQVVEAMTILPEFAWRIAKHKHPPPITVGNAKQGEDSQLAIGVATSVQEEGGESRSQSRDIHYTDSNVAQMQEQNYGMPYDTQHGFQYLLDAEVHNVDTVTQPRSKAKRYFTTLSLSATGSTFQQAKFQIDTVAICNTMSHTTLCSLLPDTQINRSPYLLYLYGSSKPLQPIGQVELVCEKAEKYETLFFQILPDTLMGPKPALLSDSDSEPLGLIKVQADEIHSLPSIVEASGTAESSQPSGDKNPSGTSAPPNDTEPSTQCNHLQQIHKITADQCHPSPSPSVTSNCCLPPPSSLTKGDVLRQL